MSHKDLIVRQRTCWCVQRRYTVACQIYTHTRVLRETEIHIARSDDWSVNEPRFIIPLSGARAPPGANCHGENTPALICRSTHHQLLGKLRGYAATRLVHASCFSMSSKVVFPVSGDEISLLVSSVFQRNRLRPIRVKGLKYINRESLIFYSFIFKFDAVIYSLSCTTKKNFLLLRNS